MYRNALLAGAAALFLAGAGIASAAEDVQTPPSSGSMPSTDFNSSSDMKSSSSSSTLSGAISSSPRFSTDLKGKDLIGPEGTKIGDIEDVIGEKLIVGVGEFLGIGERKVELGANQVTVTGSDKDLKATTSLSKEELKAMPEWKAPETPRAQRAPTPMSPPASSR